MSSQMNHPVAYPVRDELFLWWLADPASPVLVGVSSFSVQ